MKTAVTALSVELVRFAEQLFRVDRFVAKASIANPNLDQNDIRFSVSVPVFQEKQHLFLIGLLLFWRCVLSPHKSY